MNRILTKEITKRIIDKCLSKYEKDILTIRKNDVINNPEDQLFRKYGNFCMRYDEDDFCKYFIEIVEDKSYILEQIKHIQENIEMLFNMENYKLRTEYTGSSHSKTNIDSENTNINKNLSESYSLENVENETYYKGSSNTRQGNSETNKLQDIESQWEQETLSLQPDKRIIKRKEIASPAETLITEDRTTPPTSYVPKIKRREDIIHYQNFALNKTLDANVNYGLNQLEATTSSKSNNEMKNSNTRVENVGTDSNSMQLTGLEAQALLQAWHVDLPKLREKFWKSFNKLFFYGHLY